MGNVHMEATQINYRGGSKKMSVEEAIKAAGTEITPEEKTWIDSIPALTTSNAGKTDQDVIAPEFDAEAGVYAVGDKVMYEGKLYEFTSAHETPGDWDSTEVSETTVADELSSLESGLTDLNNTSGNHASGALTANNEVVVDLDAGGAYMVYTHGVSPDYDTVYYCTVASNNVSSRYDLHTASLMTVTNMTEKRIKISNSGDSTASYVVKNI